MEKVLLASNTVPFSEILAKMKRELAEREAQREQQEQKDNPSEPTTKR
jgi:hypothetical protein